jgi:hypothetical protein
MVKGRSSKLGRRRFIVGGATGGVLIAVSGKAAMAQAATGEAEVPAEGAEQSRTLAAIVGGAAAGATSVAVRWDGGQSQVQPVGFPKDWAFIDGDQVAVNHDTGEALPYVRTEVADGKVCWVAHNVDPNRERVIAAR